MFTPFVVENGVVRTPGPGEHLPLLEFTIGETQQVGTLSTGERVFESTLEVISRRLDALAAKAPPRQAA